MAKNSGCSNTFGRVGYILNLISNPTIVYDKIMQQLLIQYKLLNTNTVNAYIISIELRALQHQLIRTSDKECTF